MLNQVHLVSTIPGRLVTIGLEIMSYSGACVAVWVNPQKLELMHQPSWPVIHFWSWHKPLEVLNLQSFWLKSTIYRQPILEEPHHVPWLFVTGDLSWDRFQRWMTCHWKYWYFSFITVVVAFEMCVRASWTVPLAHEVSASVALKSKRVCCAVIWSRSHVLWGLAGVHHPVLPNYLFLYHHLCVFAMVRCKCISTNMTHIWCLAGRDTGYNWWKAHILLMSSMSGFGSIDKRIGIGLDFVISCMIPVNPLF